jgi:hypothetical protein
MATTTPLRSAIQHLALQADRDLAALWRNVETAAQAHTALNDVLPALVQQYGAAAATLAATWYDDLRAKHDVRGTFRAITADLGTSGATALAGYGAAAVARNGGIEAAQTLVSMGLQRRISNYSRQTVMDSSLADPGARGWQRETNGGCAFCEMVASRGVVFSEASADFASHDGCQCSAVPAFNGDPKPVKPYTPSARNITDADRARVREYLRTH